jgi:dsRNA-specific ribonuclease
MTAKYEVVDTSGPQHKKIFKVKCTLIQKNEQQDQEDTFETFIQEGTSINRAKHCAADIAFQKTKLQKPTEEQLKIRYEGKLVSFFIINKTMKKRK